LVVIRGARSQERHALEDLQLRASTHWPTYRVHLAAHPGVVAIPPAQIDDGLVRVAERGGEVAGFAVLLRPVAGACELDGLFVEPSHMRGGVGRLLVEDAARIAAAQGAEWIDVTANPDAVGFYERVGFSGDDEVATRFGPARRMRLALVSP
jgi:GNAT superfamily N-acetyltransferase